MGIFSAFKSKIKKSFPGKSSARKSSSITPVFFSYKDITLKLFLEIAASGDVRKLLIQGDAPEEVLHVHWEKIIQAHNYHNGSQQYLNYLNLLKNTRDLLRKSNTVQECLTWLLGGGIDNSILEWLAANGFKLETRKGQKAYEESLQNALTKSTNLNSKLAQKYNQLAMFNASLLEARKAMNEETNDLEQCLANLSYYLGFPLDESLTLARYNEYCKLINKQNAPRTQRHYNR